MMKKYQIKIEIRKIIYLQIKIRYAFRKNR